MKVEKILKPGESCYRIAQADQIDILVDAAPYYKAIYSCITQAQKSILFLGWQFDTRVPLLRGEEAERAEYPVSFLPLLQTVTGERPDLQIYILAWDHSIIFATEREWWQGYRFQQTPSDRIHFHFDSLHPTGGSHHQKIVVVDSRVAFCGGLDICADRWDTQQHQRRNPLRKNPDGSSYDLFHDVQIAVQGEAVAILEDIFRERWVAATSEPLRLERPKEKRPPLSLPNTIRLPAGPVGISRTVPIGSCGVTASIEEIACFYEKAISGADRFILIENQYFTSRKIFEALVRRMMAPNRPPIEIVFILPHRPQNWKEQLAIGFEQRRMLQRLEKIAKSHGSSVGVYTPIKAGTATLPAKSIYVHSKVLIVDNRILSVGSANTTNRSLGLDTECNIAIEAENEAQSKQIALTCFALLAEHLEQPIDKVEMLFKGKKGWVDYLDSTCRKGEAGRLHRLNEVWTETWVDEILPGGICFDPESPLQAENFFEEILSPFEPLDEEIAGEALHETEAPSLKKEARLHPAEKGARPSKRNILLKGLLLFLFPLTGLSFYLFLDPHNSDSVFWVTLLDRARHASWTVPVFLAGTVVASLISFPIISFIVLGGILFGPVWGGVLSLAGALLGAIASYFMGLYFGQPLIQRFGGKRVQTAQRWLRKKGFWTIVAVRVIGVFPFTVINFCAGASRMAFSHYIGGTVFGMLPGSFFIAYFAHSILEGTLHVSSTKIQLILGFVLFLFWIVSSFLKKRILRRREEIAREI